MNKLRAWALISFSILSSYNVHGESTQTLKLIVSEKGFEPSTLSVKPNVPTILKITRKSDATCARDLVIPSQKVKVELPLNKEVTVNVGSLAKGEIKFGCAMNMMVSGVMHVE